MLGNRDDQFKKFGPSTSSGLVKICPACCEAENVEWHMIVECNSLNNFRKDCFINIVLLEDYFESIRSTKELSSPVYSA